MRSVIIVINAAARLFIVAAVAAGLYAIAPRPGPKDAPQPPVGANGKPWWLGQLDHVPPNNPHKPTVPVIPRDKPDGWIDLPLESNWRGVVQIDGDYREVECRIWKARHTEPGFGADITILTPGASPERVSAQGATEDYEGRLWLHVSSEATGSKLAGATIRLVAHAFGKALHGSYYTNSIRGKFALSRVD
jgi:hypothetical protein